MEEHESSRSRRIIRIGEERTTEWDDVQTAVDIQVLPPVHSPEWKQLYREAR